MFIQRETVGPFQENCYIIGDAAAGVGVIIDPGDEAERILEAARKSGLSIRAIWNTHAHLDHVCAVQPIKEALKIPFYLHPDDVILLENLPKQAAMFGIAVGPVPTVDFFFHAGASVSLGNLSARVLHTPGHTPGGIAFHFEKENVLFVGDTLFNGSIGRTDLFGGDFEALIRSIRENLLVLPDEVIVYPGHGPETAIGHERRYNPFLQGGAGDFYA